MDSDCAGMTLYLLFVNGESESVEECLYMCGLLILFVFVSLEESTLRTILVF